MIRGIIFPTQDVALAQGGDQQLFDISAESRAIDWPVDHPRGGDRVMAQGGDEGHSVPVPEGGLADQPRTPSSPAAQRGHVGLGPSFVNKNEPMEVDSALMRLPPLPLAGHIRTVLLTGKRGFF